MKKIKKIEKEEEFNKNAEKETFKILENEKKEIINIVIQNESHFYKTWKTLKAFEKKLLFLKV